MMWKFSEALDAIWIKRWDYNKDMDYVLQKEMRIGEIALIKLDIMVIWWWALAQWGLIRLLLILGFNL